ncbi:MAG: NIPSNAP family protein [Planctomycetaceae bacterium]|nr:NIPSNAP family protein [Planctomycetaceae bacterium]
MKLNSLSAWGLVLSVLLAIVALRSNSTNGEEQKMTGVFELRTYTTLEGRLPNLNARFKNHTLKLFEKHGMKNVMYWTPTDEKTANNTLIYVIWHASPEAAKKSWDGFRADPDWIKARDESEKDGKIVAKVESVYMKATDYSPKP